MYKKYTIVVTILFFSLYAAPEYEHKEIIPHIERYKKIEELKNSNEELFIKFAKHIKIKSPLTDVDFQSLELLKIAEKVNVVENSKIIETNLIVPEIHTMALMCIKKNDFDRNFTLEFPIGLSEK